MLSLGSIRVTEFAFISFFFVTSVAA